MSAHPLTPPDPAPYRHMFGVCPACGGKVLPPDWADVQQTRHDYRRCSQCGRLVMSAQEGFVVEEAPPQATRATVRALMADALAALVAEKEDDVKEVPPPVQNPGRPGDSRGE